MEDRHWNDDELISRLYGVEPLNSHLAECPECARRWEWFRNRRENLRPAEPAIGEDLLFRQRKSIIARLDRGHRILRLQPASVLAAVLLAFAILSLIRQTPRSPLVSGPQPDAQVYEEVFSLVSSSEPEAVQPLRSLFEEPQ